MVSTEVSRVRLLAAVTADCVMASLRVPSVGLEMS